MSARRGIILGWVAVTVFAGALVAVSVAAVRDTDLDRSQPDAVVASERFTEAWRRSREGTFVTTGVYERHSEVTGATVRSEDVVAQRPPRRLHRQLGGVEGRDDDRLLVCPAPPAGGEEHRAPCSLGPPGGASYAQSVQREVEGVRSITGGGDPLYTVREREPGCFELTLQRPDPRAPFGVRASFCFDAETGAVRASSVRHEGGVVELLTVTAIATTVADSDLEP